MIQIINMTESHLENILKIERECFSIPWTKTSFLKELRENKFALYFVAIDTEKEDVLGYGGMWHVINEGHITNIAVSKAHRRKGIASKIIEKFIQIAKEKEMIGLTLEVRASNKIAKDLYIKYGFKIDGIRKEYYEDNREDAIIMWKNLDFV